MHSRKRSQTDPRSWHFSCLRIALHEQKGEKQWGKEPRFRKFKISLTSRIRLESLALIAKSRHYSRLYDQFSGNLPENPLVWSLQLRVKEIDASILTDTFLCFDQYAIQEETNGVLCFSLTPCLLIFVPDFIAVLHRSFPINKFQCWDTSQRLAKARATRMRVFACAFLTFSDIGRIIKATLRLSDCVVRQLTWRGQTRVYPCLCTRAVIIIYTT